MAGEGRQAMRVRRSLYEGLEGGMARALGTKATVPDEAHSRQEGGGALGGFPREQCGQGCPWEDLHSPSGETGWG